MNNKEILCANPDTVKDSVKISIRLVQHGSLFDDSCRASFIAMSGYCLVSADYAQMELRLMAHFSQLQFSLSAFIDIETICY